MKTAQQIKEANERLKYNVLDLTNQGLDGFPFKTVLIDSFCIKEGNREKDIMIDLLGVINNSESGKYDLYCSSYLVRVGLKFYYCDFLFEATEVINAFRTVNNWVNSNEEPTILEF